MALSDLSMDFGALAPGPLDRAVLAVTGRMPENWLGMRTAILLRKLVMLRLAHPDGALDVVRWGVRLRLHPRDNGCEKNLLFTPQMYEAVERAELAADIVRVQAARSPFVFVDIGANVGLFSFFVAARAGSSAQILAIEPEPGNLSRLRFNVGLNPDLPIRVFPVALAEAAGTLAIDVNPGDRGGTRVRKVAADTTATVPAQPLLDLLLQEGITAVDALKIDVEGAEDTVLAPFFRDAPETMWPRLVLLEDSRTSWSVDLLPLLTAKGYRVTSRTRLNVMLRRSGSRQRDGTGHPAGEP